MKQIKSKLTSLLCCFALVLVGAAGCKKNTVEKQTHIGVFVPGITADSPTYANLVKGVEEAVSEYNATASEKKSATLEVFEAGTNQAEWAGKLTSLVASGKYNVIISSNPSLPQLCAPLTEQFPTQKFILFDGSIDGNANIAAISYNQKEQSYLSGYIAGLMSKNHKVGLIAGQEYPIMNNVLFPYFVKGAKDAEPTTTAELRVVGNWYDAAKGAELADALFAAGVDVMCPICGGASQGVIASAKSNNFYLTWFDENGFAKAPGNVISSCRVKQNLASKVETLNYLNGKTEWGKTKIVGFKEGYVEFIQDDPLYTAYVPEIVRAQMAALVAGYQNGSVTIPEL